MPQCVSSVLSFYVDASMCFFCIEFYVDASMCFFCIEVLC